MTAILIIFAAFVLLLILNPNMSCFGRRVKSPFYPLLQEEAPEGPGRRKESAAEDRRLWVQIDRPVRGRRFTSPPCPS
ncbi:MAG: hypothetical protein MZU79_05135 [Anaerotruncus sp.]|nr:hypothetical protein [Anaerotruncus sp.]